ncbi:hypothetical protein AOX55_00001095 [Sinorhizobium fredii CCBAU 25509]|nr:hypothetical protein SF83666_c08660 [Sinorhizobium fredii CCBAU 83666]AWM24371.1 hypothetical protein AOX55_00001095 [Sinorhizobium fredii CCBAU 25509]
MRMRRRPAAGRRPLQCNTAVRVQHRSLHKFHPSTWPNRQT